MPGRSTPLLLILSEMVVPGKHGLTVQARTPMEEAELMDPMNEKANVPSVPSSWMGLEARIERGTAIRPDVIVTGSADASPGTLVPRIAAVRRKRSGLFMAPSTQAIQVLWLRRTADSNQPTKRAFLPNV
jgi:hypothetical protein